MLMFCNYKFNFVVYILAFLAWRLFGLLLKKLGDFEKSLGHPGWHACAVSSPPRDITFAQPAGLSNDIIFCLHWEEITYLSIKLGII
jgi:hypothetical protein